MNSAHIRPGIKLGAYPQRPGSQLSAVEQRLQRFLESMKTRLNRGAFTQKFIVRHVNRYQQSLQDCSEQDLSQAIAELKAELCQHQLARHLVIKSFAIIREVAFRTLGKRHYDVQLFGGWIMINGMLAEMQTGEGKTLATTLPACTAALAGIPVHVITANDYLAARDANTMMPLYDRLGLTASAVVDGMNTAERQTHYQANIVHTTNKQITFDYLRDRIEMGDDTRFYGAQYQLIKGRQKAQVPGKFLLRGLCFALVDEADSVLIDEAKTPLIITKTIDSEDKTAFYTDALHLASKLLKDQDYLVNNKQRSVDISQQGQERLTVLSDTMDKSLQHKRQREAAVKQALLAQLFYKLNHQYVINDGKIQIVDESTGRIMADRSWEQGLHQMIEAKEGCLISELREPQARISYQRFFSQYLMLGGASGTVKEVSAELSWVYGLNVFKVATNRPLKRKMLGERIYLNVDTKKQVLIARIQNLLQQNRAILIGTSSVEESELVSAWLTFESIEHRVLNAKQDKQEAQIISAAGQPKAITIATNIAGRGTDIELAKGLAQAGGLHVIALCRNSSRRVDRQLYGRCARQGDPGSAEAILSLQDPLLAEYYSPTVMRFFEKLCFRNKPIAGVLSWLILHFPQRRNEVIESKVRRLLSKQDHKLRRVLAFSGKFE